jgi:adenine C2-methylase RlmN of 23S rRNA A2503 and tRNA A37
MSNPDEEKRIAELEAENARLRELAEEAYMEGYKDTDKHESLVAGWRQSLTKELLYGNDSLTPPTTEESGDG